MCQHGGVAYFISVTHSTPNQSQQTQRSSDSSHSPSVSEMAVFLSSCCNISSRSRKTASTLYRPAPESAPCNRHSMYCKHSVWSHVSSFHTLRSTKIIFCLHLVLDTQNNILLHCMFLSTLSLLVIRNKYVLYKLY